MVYSMSGFGRATATEGEIAVSVEIKAVNSKNCDIFIKCPYGLSFLEEAIRAQVKERLVRGKIELSITGTGLFSYTQSVDFDLLDKFHENLKQIEKRYGLRRTKDAAQYIRADGAFVSTRAIEDEGAVEALVNGAVDEALDGLVQMREREGANLVRDLGLKFEEIRASLSEIEKIRPQMVEKKYDQMRERLARLLSSPGGEKPDEEMMKPDDYVLAQEVALFADKVDIEEEVVRLKSHLKQAESTIEAGGSIGRKLDFIAQELLREANTIGSKSPDTDIVRHVITMKSAIDRIKEQVQNIL